MLESTEPAASSVLDTAPESITLRFNEAVNTELGWVRIFDSNAKRIVDAGVVHAENANSVRAEIPDLGAGGYVVVWRVVSADGHPVEGAFTFQVGSSSSPVNTEVIATVVTNQEGSPWLGRSMGAAKMLVYLAAAWVIGIALIGDSQVRSIRVGSAVGGAGALLHLMLLGSYSVGGTFSDVADLGLVQNAINTRTGIMIVARIALFATLAVVVGLIPKRAVLIGGALAAISLAVGGHAGALSPAAVMVSLGALHIFAVWVWIGSIAVLALRTSHADLVDSAGSISRLMNVVLPTLVVTGVLSAGKNMDGWGSVFDTTYGRIVSGKMIAVVLLAFMGLAVRRSIRGRVERARRFIAAELLIVVAVFVATAVLSATPPNAGATNGNVFHRTLVEAGILADVTVDPGTVGNNEVHLEFSPPGGSLAPVREVSVRYSLPERDIPFFDATVTASSVNHWIGVMSVPYEGDWTIEVLVKSSANESIRYALTVPVGG